jgi:hypothetical protein
MVGPVLSASRSWDNGACTQPPAELPASATMGIGKDSISRLPYFAFFSSLLLLGMLITCFAIFSSLLSQYGRFS